MESHSSDLKAFRSRAEKLLSIWLIQGVKYLAWEGAEYRKIRIKYMVEPSNMIQCELKNSARPVQLLMLLPREWLELQTSWWSQDEIIVWDSRERPDECRQRVVAILLCHAMRVPGGLFWFVEHLYIAHDECSALSYELVLRFLQAWYSVGECSYTSCFLRISY